MVAEAAAATAADVATEVAVVANRDAGAHPRRRSWRGLRARLQRHLWRRSWWFFEVVAEVAVGVPAKAVAVVAAVERATKAVEEAQGACRGGHRDDCGGACQ